MGNRKKNNRSRSKQSKSKSGTSSSHNTQANTPEVKWSDERPESSQSGNKSDSDDETLGSSSKSEQGARWRLRIDRVRSYWNSITIDSKKEFLRISIDDLLSHYESSNKTNGNDFIILALSRLMDYKTWNFWVCYVCPRLYTRSAYLFEHIDKEHMGNLLPQMKKIYPRIVEDKWIRDCSWKPLDGSAAVEMLEEKAKPEDTNKSEETNITEGVEEYVDASAAVNMLEDDQAKPEDTNKSEETNITQGVEEYVDASAAVKMLEDDQAKPEDTNKSEETNITQGIEEYVDASAAVKMLEDDQAKPEDTNKSEETNITQGVEVEGSVADSIWPKSDDSKRAQLLQKIHGGFDILIRHKCLATGHLNKVIKFSMDKIQGLAARAKLMQQHLDRSATCICFLEARELGEIFKFLLELTHACGLSICADKSNNPMDDLHNSNQIPEVKEKIVLNEDASFLLLNECLVPEEITPGATESAEMERFLSWMFTGSSWVNQMKLTVSKKQQNKSRGLELVQAIRNEFHQVQHLSKKKCEQTNYKEEELQLSEIDREIMRRVAEIDRLGFKLGSIFAFDCRPIILPVVKIYLWARLEFWAENATKSNEEREALWAELILGSEKDFKGESDDEKPTKKTKDKRKNEENRKTSDPKATYDLEQHILDSTTPDSSSAGHDKDHDSIPSDLEQLKEEEIDEEAENKKLSERLEENVKLKRRTLDEAKKKRLAEKRRDLKEGAERCKLELEKEEPKSSEIEAQQKGFAEKQRDLKEGEIDGEEENKKLSEQLEENVKLKRRILDEAKKKRLAEKRRDLNEGAEGCKLELEKEEAKSSEIEAEQKGLAEKQKDLKEGVERRKLELEKEEAKSSEIEAEQKGLAEKQRDLKEGVERRKLELEKVEAKLAEIEAEQKRLAGQHRDLKEEVEKRKLELEKEEAKLSEIEAE